MDSGEKTQGRERSGGGVEGSTKRDRVKRILHTNNNFLECALLQMQVHQIEYKQT